MEIETEWIKQFEEAERVYELFYKDKVDSIKIFSLYVNSDCILEKIKQKKYNINNGEIQKDELLSIIKNHRNDENIKYRLLSLFSYNITLDPEDIKNYILTDAEDSYMSMHRHLEEIKFNDSIKMLKDLNSIFLFFYEIPRKLNKNNTKKIYLHSSSQKKTKRNRLKDN